MKLFHLLSVIGTAITLTRAADYKKYAVVVISVPAPVVHDVSVFAKPSSELDPVTRWAAADVGVGCLKKYRDPVTGECPYNDYLDVTSVEFIRPTNLPRNITVKFKDYTIQCTFALNQAMDGRVVAWRVHRDWGLDGRKSDFEIACDNSTAYYGEPFGRAESEMPVTTAV